MSARPGTHHTDAAAVPGPRTWDDAAPIRTGLVSVVVVNYKGADDTITCLEGLASLDWPAADLELICIENESGDGSADRIRAALPGVTLIESGANLGFAGGCNLGARAAHGEFVAFLNNDARPDARWVAAAVEVFHADREVGAVASKVLDWDGRLVDFADASLTWWGGGYKREAEHVDDPEYDRPKDVLFGTGAAMFVRAAVYRDLGGFDERFFMFYEDVDFGWRLNALGHRFRFVPASLAYHRHHATMKKFGSYRESYLLERNAMLSMYKNYEDETLLRTLPAAFALSVRRSVARTGLDARMLDLQVRPGGDEEEDVTVPKMALTGPLAIDYFVEQLPSLMPDRRDIQARRRRSDLDLFPLFRQAIEPAYPFPSYLAAHQDLLEAFGIEEVFSRRRRVAVVTGEPLGGKMAGPAIRAFEISRLLGVEHDVRLVTTASRCTLDGDGFETGTVNRQQLHGLVEWADVLIFQGLLLSFHTWIADADVILVADVYDPFHLETLEQERARSDEERMTISRDTVDALNRQLARADFLLCASEKQRDFWLGQLAGMGRINPYTYDEDESLRGLIDVAPFGLQEGRPVQTRHALKGTFPGIGTDDKVVIWGGGVYNWFDPLTLIHAIDKARQKVPEIRLVFLGMKHPNPGVPEMDMAHRTRALAADLGLEGTHVFFNEQWVAYDDRQNYLLDADLGVSCHFDHVETEFSFRTRILDYLWAGLPIVCTDGDAFGDLVERESLGVAVPPEDVDALADALVLLLTDTGAAAAASARAREISQQFTWSRSLAPLAAFVRSPRRAPDVVAERGELSLRSGRAFRAALPKGRTRDDMSLARRYFEEGGVTEVARRASGRVIRIIRRG
ncbi:glycosyltransferase [Lapillicoccus sp.]|uniref:glycosyltransferase n=1 Tax=Lapillicoccus sp. TaxID=1909287 RepID=UPI0025D824AC|nr:glycosyltransferase [Lapillicoccus sp.]